MSCYNSGRRRPAYDQGLGVGSLPAAIDVGTRGALLPDGPHFAKDKEQSETDGERRVEREVDARQHDDSYCLCLGDYLAYRHQEGRASVGPI